MGDVIRTLVRALIAEGPRQDARKLFTGTPEEFAALEAVLPRASKSRYIVWAVRMHDDGFSTDAIGKAAAIHDENRDRLDPSQRDPNFFSDPETMVSNSLFRRRAARKEAQKVARAVLPADRVFEGESLIVVRIDSHGQACKYGKGTKWCITEEDPENFDSYVGKEAADPDDEDNEYEFAENEAAGAWFYYFISRTDPAVKVALLKESTRALGTLFDPTDTKVTAEQARALFAKPEEFDEAIVEVDADYSRLRRENMTVVRAERAEEEKFDREDSDIRGAIARAKKEAAIRRMDRAMPTWRKDAAQIRAFKREIDRGWGNVNREHKKLPLMVAFARELIAATALAKLEYLPDGYSEYWHDAKWIAKLGDEMGI